MAKNTDSQQGTEEKPKGGRRSAPPKRSVSAAAAPKRSVKAPAKAATKSTAKPTAAAAKPAPAKPAAKPSTAAAKTAPAKKPASASKAPAPAVRAAKSAAGSATAPAKVPSPPQRTDRAELAVRRYLEFVADPSTAVDASRVDQLNRRLAAESDIVQRLKIRSELTLAVNGDSDTLVRDFVTHAKSFATANGIPASSFSEMGVTDDVLAAAGLIATPSRKRTSTPEKRTRVSSGSIGDAALASTAPFTILELAAITGASVTGVKKVLDAMIAEGRIEMIGPDPAHSGRGRAPSRFTLT